MRAAHSSRVESGDRSTKCHHKEARMCLYGNLPFFHHRASVPPPLPTTRIPREIFILFFHDNPTRGFIYFQRSNRAGRRGTEKKQEVKKNGKERERERRQRRTETTREEVEKNHDAIIFARSTARERDFKIRSLDRGERTNRRNVGGRLERRINLVKWESS